MKQKVLGFEKQDCLHISFMLLLLSFSFVFINNDNTKTKDTKTYSFIFFFINLCDLSILHILYDPAICLST